MHAITPWRNGQKSGRWVPRLVAPPPEIVFGDFYLAWNATGLHLAMIAMDYYDPDPAGL